MVKQGDFGRLSCIAVWTQRQKRPHMSDIDKPPHEIVDDLRAGFFSRKASTFRARRAELERFDPATSIWSPVGSDETDLALPKGGGFLLRLAK